MSGPIFLTFEKSHLGLFTSKFEPCFFEFVFNLELNLVLRLFAFLLIFVLLA